MAGEQWHVVCSPWIDIQIEVEVEVQVESGAEKKGRSSQTDGASAALGKYKTMHSSRVEFKSFKEEGDQTLE